jgi:predicted phosphodiesterase
VKILALSDEVADYIYSPKLKERFPGVKLVLGCGDVPFFYLEFVVTMFDRPLYYVHGNHDKSKQYLSDGRVVDRAEGCEPVENKVVRLAVDGQELLLAGLGGSLRYNNEAEHQYTQAEMVARVARLAPALTWNRLRYGRALDILITHAPPRGIHDATDLAHTGFDAFKPLMESFRPRFLLHGHSHVYRNDVPTATRYKDTQVLNVYPYRVIEFEKDYV